MDRERLSRLFRRKRLLRQAQDRLFRQAQRRLIRTGSEQAVSESDEPLNFYISLTFIDEKTKEPVVADVTLMVDDDGDGDPETGTWLEPPCVQTAACDFSIPVDGMMYVYAIEADGYEPHSLGVRPHYETERRLSGEVPLTRIVPGNVRTG